MGGLDEAFDPADHPSEEIAHRSPGTSSRTTGGVALLVSVLTGIYLWWPSRNQLVRALTVKRRASRERLIFDPHKVFGIYSAPVLAVVAFSGVYLVFFDYVRPMANLFSPVELDGWADPHGLTSKITPGATPIPIASAVSAAESVFPEARLRRVGRKAYRENALSATFIERNRIWRGGLC